MAGIVDGDNGAGERSVLFRNKFVEHVLVEGVMCNYEMSVTIGKGLEKGRLVVKDLLMVDTIPMTIP